MFKFWKKNLKQHKILFFKPYLKEVVWAGDKLGNFFKTKHKIGEAWLISAISDKESTCLNTTFKTRGLREIFHDQKELFGTKYATYPNLSKIIDTSKPLSVQVHPNNKIAQAFNSLGKEECWYVLANDGSPFVLGDKAKTKALAIKLIRENNFQKLLQYHDVKVGDFLYVPAGVIHAIPQNTTVFELQQSSDLTFRLYDYDRIDVNGQPRELHTDQSCKALSIKKSYFIKNQPTGELVHNQFFNFFKIINHGIQEYNFDNKNWIELIVIEGQGTIDKIPIKKYSAMILTKGNNQFQLSGELTILINIIE